jgi:hypothetical protein
MWLPLGLLQGLDASCFLVRAALTHGPRWISASDVLEHVTSALQGLISLHSPALPKVLAILPGLAHAVSAQPRAQPNVAQLRQVLEQATLAAYMDEQSTGNKSRVLKVGDACSTRTLPNPLTGLYLTVCSMPHTIAWT